MLTLLVLNLSLLALHVLVLLVPTVLKSITAHSIVKTSPVLRTWLFLCGPFDDVSCNLGDLPRAYQ